MNFYYSLPEQTKVNIDLLKTALRDRYHTQDRLYNIRVKLHELRQGFSLEANINDLDNLARHLQLPEQQKINYFIFGLKPKLKPARLVQQPQTYDDAVIFAKRKHYFADTDSDTQLMDLLQEIHNEVSFKRTGFKQELYSTPVQDTNANQLQQDILQLQADMQILIGFNDHTPTPICCSFRYQHCHPSTTVVQDESRNQALTAHETPTPLFLEITEILGPRTVWLFVDDVTV